MMHTSWSDHWAMVFRSSTKSDFAVFNGRQQFWVSWDIRENTSVYLPPLYEVQSKCFRLWRRQIGKKKWRYFYFPMEWFWENVWNIWHGIENTGQINRMLRLFKLLDFFYIQAATYKLSSVLSKTENNIAISFYTKPPKH